MAKKYSFAMENVLNHRQIIEDQCKRDFALSLKVLQECEMNLSKIEEIMRFKTAEMSTFGNNKVFSSMFFIEFQNYMRRLQREKKNQERKILNAKIDVDQKREKLIEATRNKKVILRLKEIDIKKYTAMMNKLEQNFIDEVAIMNYVNKNHSYGA